MHESGCLSVNSDPYLCYNVDAGFYMFVPFPLNPGHFTITCSVILLQIAKSESWDWLILWKILSPSPE